MHKNTKIPFCFFCAFKQVVIDLKEIIEEIGDRHLSVVFDPEVHCAFPIIAYEDRVKKIDFHLLSKIVNLAEDYELIDTDSCDIVFSEKHNLIYISMAFINNIDNKDAHMDEIVCGDVHSRLPFKEFKVL